MSTITKEWLLKTIAELEEERDAVPGAVNEDAAMALAAMNIALASLEAEPIYQLWDEGYYDTQKETYDAVLNAVGTGVRGRIVYTAPPAPECLIRPVHPRISSEELDDETLEELIGFRRSTFEYHSQQGNKVQTIIHGVTLTAMLELRERRAAMLQGAENAESPTTMQTAPSLDSSQIIAESPSGNSPVIPDCSCGTCRPVTFTDSRFVVCSECGNKRCPHANDHRNACTGSNEPGQEGRAYPAAPQQEVK
ncbi:TPA: hypothetical protein ACOEHF_000546 [Enterobacter hormaechei subsp. xiangfangensis]|nr:hypothetical protein [Enterobacter hormaechei subsp. steigerwaltii]